MHSWEWLAGLYEGEGTLFQSDHQVGLRIKMCDEDVVRSAHAVAGVGHVYGPYQPKNEAWSPTWIWLVQKRSDVAFVIEQLLPWLHGRRAAKAQEVLEWCRANPGRGRMPADA